jgi:uncharacterized membrane protein
MLHAAIVHFPIVLLAVAGVLYLLQLVQPARFAGPHAFWAHVAGTVGLAMAVLSGNAAESEAIHTEAIHELIEQHELLGFASLWGFGLLLLWRFLRRGTPKRMLDLAFVAVFAVLLGLVAYSSHIGGEMVYEKGVGVAPMKPLLEHARQQEQRP